MKAIVLEKTLVHDGNRFLIDVEFPEIKQTVRLALDETAPILAAVYQFLEIS